MWIRHCVAVGLTWLALVQPASLGAGSDDSVQPGWTCWRGPEQNGASREIDLPATWKPGGDHHLWSFDLQGRGTAVTHGDRVYAWGYYGEKTDLVEALVCLNAKTGEKIWEHRFNDFISDIIYNRYAIGAPAVDAVTGRIYLMTSPGLAMCLDRQGKLLWQHSMLESFGRLTFPNGRTGAPVIDNEFVIFRGITTNWGSEGPARDRFYAFDKRTGELVWRSTPGVGPPFLKDSSFSTPVVETRKGLRLFYAGTGCGNVVCVNARTGVAMWRYQLALGGVNSSPVIHGNKLIVPHGKENVDDSGRGRMVAIDLDRAIQHTMTVQSLAKHPYASPTVLDKSFELWRNDDISMFTSSPTLHGNRVYQLTAQGELFAVDVETGKTIWRQKLGNSTLHASPLWADHKLYVPMWDDGLYILKDAGDEAEVLCHVEAEQIGKCIGSPSVWNGQIYLHTTNRLYCLGRKGDAIQAIGKLGKDLVEGGLAIAETAGDAVRTVRPTGKAERLQIVPAEVLLHPGETTELRVREVDHQGRLVRRGAGTDYRWSRWIPPTAKVKAELDASMTDGRLGAAKIVKYSAGAFKAERGDGVFGTMRGRILPDPPFSENFERFALDQTDPGDQTRFGYPPLPWIGARLKWQVRQVGDSKVLAKTLDRVLFQRSMVFLGHADASNYTLAADLMTDGNRRLSSVIGLINQRYLVTLDGNWGKIEVSSNHERLKVSKPFDIKPKTWYRLKTRVDAKADGSGAVRAKAWPRDADEPDGWTIEVPVERVHAHGSPGLYGFSPQSLFRVYIDNVVVTPNTPSGD